MEHFKEWLSEETLAELGIRMSENSIIGIYADLNRMDNDGFQHPYYWAAFGFTGV